MKIKEFFFNCLNRRSFHFLSTSSFISIVLPILAWQIYSKLIYSGDNIFSVVEHLLSSLILYIFPTFGLATIIATIIIYIKLLLREDLNPEYRIKNKFLSKNPVYGFFLMIFFLLAVYIIIGSLFLISSVLIEDFTLGLLEEISIPFIGYIIILLFVIIRV